MQRRHGAGNCDALIGASLKALHVLIDVGETDRNGVGKRHHAVGDIIDVGVEAGNVVRPIGGSRQTPGGVRTHEFCRALLCGKAGGAVNSRRGVSVGDGSQHHLMIGGVDRASAERR